MAVEIGIIGGSGLYDMADLTEREDVTLTTPFGPPSGPYVTATLRGRRVAFLARHGAGHRILPSELNFRANIFGFVAHVGFAHPVCGELGQLVSRAAKAVGATVHTGGTYVCMEGPQFSTLAESRLYRSWGMDVIGMTNLQEAKLAREAEICYSTIALVTDYDCWHEDHDSVSVEMIISNLTRNAATAQAVIAETIRLLPAGRACACGRALATAIITRPEHIPAQIRRELAPIIGRYIATS
ncbi:MAG: S-methyl-5'-thioadenosine phosphorylase [Acidobacteria bacterium]|nr:S-methyl-5'-thioadenosine phosphorylase [Acidobacteriota bacterium]